MDYQNGIRYKLCVLIGLKQEFTGIHTEKLTCIRPFSYWFKVFVVVNHAVRLCIQVIVYNCLAGGIIFLHLHPASEEVKE